MLRPQAGEGEVAHVVPVDAHRAAGRVVEPGQHPGHGGLAASGAPDQGDRLARAQVQVEVAQHAACPDPFVRTARCPQSRSSPLRRCASVYSPWRPRAASGPAGFDIRLSEA